MKRKTHIANDRVVFIASMTGLMALAIDFGFPLDFWSHLLTDFFYVLFSLLFSIKMYDITFVKKSKSALRRNVRLLIFGLSIALLLLSLANTFQYLFAQDSAINQYVAGLVFFLALLDLSERLYRLERQTLHPALVFVVSFLVLISIGTLLLMLPNATVDGIRFIDALFTSTSAVCVTGLAVLDTGADFTFSGQCIILMLIQLGALGMLTFTNLFGLFFRGFGTFTNRLMLKDMINAQSVGNTFKTLIQIIIFTFTVEILGAVFIFHSLDQEMGAFGQRFFFAVFHSVSAFCNAGFSTLSNSLYETGFRFNYNLHIIIAFLIILGGIGYSIVINYYTFIRDWLTHQFYKFQRRPVRNKLLTRPVITANTRIVMFTSLALIIGGTVLFFVYEQDNTLQEHSAWGKWVTAFFGSVTTRTAGFNTVDTGALSISTLMIYFLLMWIGASPGSTGGGIKTTTFAVSLMNIYQQALGKEKLVLKWKKIPQKALQRATAIIMLSILGIGFAVFGVMTFDGELGLLPVVFECVSAFSTVGLSMGITAELGDAGKGVITAAMFVGRVGFLTLLSGIARQMVSYSFDPAEYPEEEIFIN